MKKTLIIIPTNDFGGAELLLNAIALELSKNNFVYQTYLFSQETFVLKENLTITSLSQSNKFTGSFKLISFLFKNNPFDFVITSQVYLNGFLGILRALKILKTDILILRETTPIFRRFVGLKLFSFKLFYTLGYNFSDSIICPTDIIKTDLLKNCKKAKRWNIRVIPNPINLETLDNLSNDNSYDNHFNNNFIVAAGRLIKIKGFDILIAAFSFVVQTFPDLHLYILGDGEEKDNLQKQIINLGLESQITLFGFVKNPIPFFKNAKACVVSSLIEGFPNVLLQMMSQNDRVVSTICAGGINEINGLFTCVPGNPNLLAEKIYEALLTKDVSQIRNSFNLYLNKNSLKNYIATLL